MATFKIDRDRRDALVLRATAVFAGTAALLSVVGGSYLTALLTGLVTASLWLLIRRSGRIILTDSELDRLREAELSLATDTAPHEAARELAQHASELLGARSAV
ncbi:MAG: hypothetical protein OSA99_01835, partial [Acidimicrobiales bacterium]|nr:hypothetical protein [Acidimicrobiales bacterium]